MAIAGSKLGQFVLKEGGSDHALLQRLRELGLVSQDASDNELAAVLNRARQEHAALPDDVRPFNSPHERVRVFLAPYLTEKGQAWAVPLKSLRLRED